MSYLPAAGIVAFSLASTWALVNLFNAQAKHAHWLYWLPAVLVELVNAWIVYQAVQVFRRMTASRISKQDLRFYRSVFLSLCLLALPTLAVSVWANRIELKSIWLGLLFPVSSLGCAVTGAIPVAMDGHEARKRREAQEKEREQARKQAEREQQILAQVGKEMATLRYFTANPTATQEQAAEALNVSRRTIGNHLERLGQAQAIKRTDGRVDVLVEV